MLSTVKSFPEISTDAAVAVPTELRAAMLIAARLAFPLTVKEVISSNLSAVKDVRSALS